MISFAPLVPVWLLLLSLAAVGYCIFRTTTRRRLRLVCWLLAGLLAFMAANPVVILRRPDDRTGRVAVLVDSSLSMGVRDAGNGESRFAAADEFARQLLRRLGNDVPVTRFDFDWQLREEHADEPAGAAHFRGAFAALDRRYGAGALAATVLLTDGGDLSGHRVESSDSPVFAVKFGSELNAAPNLSFGEFRVPETARAGASLDLRIPVTLTGFEAPRQVEFKLLVDGEPAASERFELRPGETRQIPVKAELAMAGLHRLTFELAPLPGEVTALDNRRTAAVDAEPDSRFTLISFARLSTGFRPLVRFFFLSKAEFTDGIESSGGSMIGLAGGYIDLDISLVSEGETYVGDDGLTRKNITVEMTAEVMGIEQSQEMEMAVVKSAKKFFFIPAWQIDNEVMGQMF